MIEKRQATILVVDDEAANIHLLTEFYNMIMPF